MQNGVLDGLGRQGNHASATATEQGDSLGASPLLQGGTKQPSEQPRHLSAEGVGSRIHAPAFWHADGTELKCLQDAQVTCDLYPALSQAVLPSCTGSFCNTGAKKRRVQFMCSQLKP